MADLYVAALEEAAGGPAVREELLREVARGAAEVGLDDSEARRARAPRGRPWPLGPTRAPARSLVRAVPVWAWLTA